MIIKNIILTLPLLLLTAISHAVVDPPVTLEMGQHHACVLTESQKVKCWGDNYYGQLGLGDTNYRGDAANEMGQFLPYVDLGTQTKVKKVVTGDDHVCNLFMDGKVKCFGLNGNGQVGLGNSANWSDSSNETGENLPYLDFGTNKKVVDIEAGGNFNCVLFEDYKIKCWGQNGNGQLGIGSTDQQGDNPNEMNNLKTVELGDNLVPAQMALGLRHSCVLFKNNKVKCWGENNLGQLGIGNTNSKGDNAGEMGNKLPYVDLMEGEVIKKISAGNSFTCALFENGSLKCWGNNMSGQLGVGHSSAVGNESGEMGENLMPAKLGSFQYVTDVWASKRSHICGRFINNTMKCWGENSSGQLGLGDTLSRGIDPDQLGLLLSHVHVGLNMGVKIVAPGNDSSCALLSGGKVKCWGQNTYGQLGSGFNATWGDNPNEMGDVLPLVDLGLLE